MGKTETYGRTTKARTASKAGKLTATGLKADNSVAVGGLERPNYQTDSSSKILSVIDVKEITAQFSPTSLQNTQQSPRGVNERDRDLLGPSLQEQFDIFEEQSIELETLFKEVPTYGPTDSLTLHSSEVKQSPPGGYTRSEKSRFYVPCKIGKVKGSFLIDTGSTVSVLSSKVVSMIGQTTDLQPIVEKLMTANGEQLKLSGKLDLKFQLEHLDFSQMFIVAEIDEEFGILGMDFLQENNASMKLGKRILKTSSGKLRLYKHTSNVCARLALEDSVVVPPRS